MTDPLTGVGARRHISTQSLVVGSRLRLRVMDNGCTVGGGDAISSPPDDQQMNCVLGKVGPQSSGCYQLRMQRGGAPPRVGDAQRQDGIPAWLSPEYPTGTHGALLDLF